MSDLTGSEHRKLEKLLGMGGGYVLNFSDRTFGDFFDEYRVCIPVMLTPNSSDCDSAALEVLTHPFQ